MRKSSYIISAALLLAGGSAASAQELSTNYFLDSYVYAHHINAALRPVEYTTSYFSLPAIGGVSASVQSNVGLKSFLFPVDGQLVWGFNNKVSAATFLGGLNDINSAVAGAGINLFSTGFRSGRAFFNIELNIKSTTAINVPKDAFAMIKNGSDDGKYSVNNLSLINREYAEVAVNMSHTFGDNNEFSIGGTIKGLVGLAGGNLTIDKINAEINAERGIVSTDGQLELDTPWAKYGTNAQGNIDLRKINFRALAVGGYGAALDLGFHWDTPLKGLSFDLGVNDIGGLVWIKNVENHFKFENEVFKGGADAVVDKVFDLLKVKLDNRNKSFRMLPTVLNTGLRYKMPFYDRLSAGVMGSFRFGDIKYNDIRLGATVTPKDWFSFAMTAGYTTFGWAWGSAMNFYLPGINIYFGLDGIPTSYGKGGIPTSRLNTVAKAGIVFTFKAAKSKAAKQSTAAAPVVVPVTVPVNVPVTVTVPAEAPATATEPAATPVETPAEATATEPTAAPVETPAEAPATVTE